VSATYAAGLAEVNVSSRPHGAASPTHCSSRGSDRWATRSRRSPPGPAAPLTGGARVSLRWGPSQRGQPGANPPGV